MSNEYENKTGTNATAATQVTPRPAAPGLGIERVWREVVDFGDPVSGTGEEGWGRKRVSVARVSILEAAVAAEGSIAGGGEKEEKMHKKQEVEGSIVCVK